MLQTASDTDRGVEGRESLRTQFDFVLPAATWTAAV